MRTSRVLLLSCAVVLVTAACKSEDEQMAENLRKEVLAAVEQAKETGSPDDLTTKCLSASATLEAPIVRDLIKRGGHTREVAQQIRKACEEAPSISELVSKELEKEMQREEEAQEKAREAAEQAREPAADEEARPVNGAPVRGEGAGEDEESVSPPGGPTSPPRTHEPATKPPADGPGQ